MSIFLVSRSMSDFFYLPVLLFLPPSLNTVVFLYPLSPTSLSVSLSLHSLSPSPFLPTSLSFSPSHFLSPCYLFLPLSPSLSLSLSLSILLSRPNFSPSLPPSVSPRLCIPLSSPSLSLSLSPSPLSLPPPLSACYRKCHRKERSTESMTTMIRRTATTLLVKINRSQSQSIPFTAILLEKRHGLLTSGALINETLNELTSNASLAAVRRRALSASCYLSTRFTRIHSRHTRVANYRDTELI